jgi:hypothetical protein
MTNILETRELGELDADVSRLLSNFELPGAKLNIKGTARYKNLHYRSDYDLLIALKRSMTAPQFFEAISDVLHKIARDRNMFFIELKLETTTGEKRRLHPRQEIRMTWLEKDFDRLSFAKIDVVIRVQNKFYEASCIYAFRDGPMDQAGVIANLQQDMNEFLKEGNYYKALKRLFSIAVLNNNQTTLTYLTNVFNSPLGQENEKLCNLKALQLLRQNYPDKSTLQKINQNIKLLNESFRIGSIGKHIKKYQRLVSKKAKLHYQELKKP